MDVALPVFPELKGRQDRETEYVFPVCGRPMRATDTAWRSVGWPAGPVKKGSAMRSSQVDPVEIVELAWST